MEHPPQPSASAAPPALWPDDFVRQISKARHDLRNPLTHILGFSQMLIEKAGDHGYNFLKARLEVVERTANEVVEQINDGLEPQKLVDGTSSVVALQSQVRKAAARILSVADSLGRKPIVRHDEAFNGDLARIIGAARHLLDLSGTALDFLLDRSQWPTAAPAEAAISPAQAPVAASRSPRVLVVDDDPATRETLRQLLGELGYAVLLADSGQRAWETVAADAVDVILLDLQMPEPDGLETLRRLKSDFVHRALPVVMLTAADESATALHCLEIGADDFVPKPVHPMLLKVRLQSALARRRLQELALMPATP